MPILNKYLINEHIIKFCCGQYYSFALTNNREVYELNYNSYIQNRNITFLFH